MHPGAISGLVGLPARIGAYSPNHEPAAGTKGKIDELTSLLASWRPLYDIFWSLEKRTLGAGWWQGQIKELEENNWLKAYEKQKE